MSGFLDALTGGGYDGEGGGIGDSGMSAFISNLAGSETQTYEATPTDVGQPYSGALQAFATTVGGYLGRRLDIDLQRRAYGSMPYPTQQGIGAEIYYTGSGAPMRPGARQTVATANLGAGGLLPWLLIAGVVYMVARRK